MANRFDDSKVAKFNFVNPNSKISDFLPEIHPLDRKFIQYILYNLGVTNYNEDLIIDKIIELIKPTISQIYEKVDDSDLEKFFLFTEEDNRALKNLDLEIYKKEDQDLLKIKFGQILEIYNKYFDETLETSYNYFRDFWINLIQQGESSITMEYMVNAAGQNIIKSFLNYISYPNEEILEEDIVEAFNEFISSANYQNTYEEFEEKYANDDLTKIPMSEAFEIFEEIFERFNSLTVSLLKQVIAQRLNKIAK